jgi:hypothetical protein
MVTSLSIFTVPSVSERDRNLTGVNMKTLLISLFLIAVSTSSFAQNAVTEQEIKNLSSMKWQWMADKDLVNLGKLFHDRAKFVHMSGTWNKDRELEIIETGSIWYKKADVHDVVIEIFNGTAILWNRITLLAVVRGSEVTNEFTVTEIYKKQEDDWKLLDLTFSKVLDTHEIAH